MWLLGLLCHKLFRGRVACHKSAIMLRPSGFGCIPSAAVLHWLQLQNKLQEARNTLQTAVDPATGKKLFQPEIGRAPTSMRNSSHLPVGEYLYSLKQQQDDKVRAAGEELDRKRREEAEKAKKANSSKALVKALQQKRFRQVRGHGACGPHAALPCQFHRCRQFMWHTDAV